MDASALAEWLSLTLVGVAVLPAAFVLGREALRRRDAKVALAEVAAARKELGGPDDPAVAQVAAMRERFDATTLERVALQLIKDDSPRARAVGAQMFAELGLVDTYARRLRDARKWSERAFAAEALGDAGAAAAVPALAEALRDPHEDETSVKVAAAAALAKLHDPGAIPLLVKELGDVEGRSSRTVAEALVAFGPLAVPDLLTLLRASSASEARVWAARILGRIADRRATDDLMARLHDRDDLLRVAATEALGSIGDPRALQALVRATLRDPAPQVRAHAAGAVGKIEGERAIDVLVAALADPDYATRLRALEAFETIRIDDTGPLESALRDPNPEVRRRAGLALERVGWLDRVVRDLQSSDHAVQARAYQSFLELGRVGLVDSIAAYVHHASFEVRTLAARAAGELGQPRVALLVLSAADDESWPVRAAACEALGRLKPERAVAVLLERLRDGEETVREMAAEALTNFSSAELAPHVLALVAAYDAGSVPVRTHAVLLAARLSGEAADALLVRASRDPSDGVRLRAVTALGSRGEVVFVEPLVARLTDASLDVRMAAVTALGSAATPQAFEGLLKALAGAKPDARERISEALSRGAREMLFAHLEELEKSPSLDVRLGVAWTLGKTADPSVVPTLARFVRDANAQLRASAVGALAKIESRASLDALIGAVNDPDGRVRAAVVNAVGRASSEPEVLRVLEARLADPDPFVRNRAIVALARVGRSSVEATVLGLSDVEPTARLVALSLIRTDMCITEALDAMSRPGMLERVVQFLDHEDRSVRAEFFDALALEDPRESLETTSDLTVTARYEGVLRTSLDVRARRIAVRSLCNVRGPRSLEILGDALAADPDEALRLAAAVGLARFVEEPVARSALVRAVADPSPEVALAAIRGISVRTERDVQLALCRRLGAGDGRVQDAVEAALAEQHRSEPTQFLDWLMGTDVPELLIPGIRVLGRIASPATLPVLVELARSATAVVRATAVRALGLIPTADADRAIDGMAQDPDEDVRLSVLDALATSRDFVMRTASHRRDPSPLVRARAAALLEGAASKAALTELQRMLEDAVGRVRAAALASLAGSKEPEGLQLFHRHWVTTNLETRLDLRTDARARPISERLAMKLKTSAEPLVRQSAIVALGAFGVSGYQSFILPSLRDPSTEVRIAAVQALASLDDAQVRGRLAEMLADPELAVRDAARRSMIHSVG